MPIESFRITPDKNLERQDDSEPLPIPQESFEFDTEKAQAWIEAEDDPEIKEIKRKIIDNIKHISFANFKELSEQTVREAVNGINEDYALLFDYKPHSSKRWFYELNTESYENNPPTKTGYFTPGWEKMSGNETLEGLTEQGINTYLISDDAGYSGEQIINRQIKPIIEFYRNRGIKPKFVLVVPFVTNRFTDLMNKIKSEGECEIELQTSFTMPSLLEILSEEEVETLKTKRNGNLEVDQTEPTYLGATLTYFDHRVADDHSFCGEVQNILNIRVPKPYGDESTPYFQKESEEFERYKEMVVPK